MLSIRSYFINPVFRRSLKKLTPSNSSNRLWIALALALPQRSCQIALGLRAQILSTSDLRGLEVARAAQHADRIGSLPIYV